MSQTNVVYKATIVTGIVADDDNIHKCTTIGDSILNKFYNVDVLNVVDFHKHVAYLNSAEAQSDEVYMDDAWPYKPEHVIGCAAITGVVVEDGVVVLFVALQFKNDYTVEDFKKLTVMPHFTDLNGRFVLHGFAVRTVPEHDGTKCNLEKDEFIEYYDKARNDLAIGYESDDYLGNKVYLHDYRSLDLKGILAGDSHSGIALLTAAKERIRWLSRQLLKAKFDAFLNRNH